MLKMLYDYQYRLNVFINVLYFLLFNNYNKITESRIFIASLKARLMRGHGGGFCFFLLPSIRRK